MEEQFSFLHSLSLAHKKFFAFSRGTKPHIRFTLMVWLVTQLVFFCAIRRFSEITNFLNEH